MVRIGILGSENSHADCFAKYFNLEGEGNRNDPDYRVTAIGGNYPDRSRAVADYYKIDLVVDKPEDMLGKVDAVMVTARDGKFHAEFAEPFVRAGLPVFVDKPFTTDVRGALDLIGLARKSGSLISGGSSVKLSGDAVILKNIVRTKSGSIHGGNVIAPVSVENEYGGFWFYSGHLIETALEIFGTDVKAVTAVRSGGDVTAIMEYPEYCVSLNFVGDCYQSYQATVISKERNYTREIDISLCFNRECEEFVKMIETGVMPQSYEELAFPVVVTAALIESLGTGKRVEVKK